MEMTTIPRPPGTAASSAPPEWRNRPLRILIISDAWEPQVNGVVRTYQHLRDELVTLGHDVRIIGPSDFPLTLPLPGYTEIRLVLRPYRRLRRYIESYGADAVHIATEGPLGRAARRYCLRHGVAFTTSYHTHFPDYIAKRVGQGLPILHNPVKRTAIRVLRQFHKPARCMMVATQSLENELKAWGFTTPMVRLSRGVRLDLFCPEGARVFADLPRPIALYVGRVAIEKNLDAFVTMPWAGSKVIIGKGPMLESLKKNYPDIVFAGEKVGADLAACYRSADVFVFPSRTDTFGIVLIEALASGLPIAAYPVTGPRDIVTEPFLGALSEDLGDAAQQALACGSAQERARYVHDHYTWPVVARDFIDGLMRE